MSMFNTQKSILKSKFKYYIGIDPGVNTGLSLWDGENKKFIIIKQMNIIEALFYCATMSVENTFFRIEDARKRKWFGKAGREQLQGAGSIKRDCQIWEEFMNHIKANCEFVAPKNNKTKLNAIQFKNITKWPGRTNEHNRDAAMLVFGFEAVIHR